MEKESSASEPPLRVIAPPPLLFLAGLIAGVLLERAVPLAEPDAWTSRALGLPLIALGAWILASAWRAFARAGTTVSPYGSASAIVREGPYAWTRNPIYVGMTLAYGGLAFAAASLWALALLPVVLGVLMLGVIRREEAWLARRFGEEYLRYRREVRRWI